MTHVSFVIPALNEQDNMARVMATIPVQQLSGAGFSHEVVVVDNGSTDDTAALAADLGARVINQSVRGYGSAYLAGFDAARGDVIVTGDADCTYPFDQSVDLVERLYSDNLDFLSTNRLGRENRLAMSRSHLWANRLLSLISLGLFRNPFRDSQSGMWIFRRTVWPELDVRSTTMAFSQEIKNEAHARGFRCAETKIEYRTRGGEVKLNALRDGLGNLCQLFGHRARIVRSAQTQPVTTANRAPELVSVPYDDAA